MRRKPSRPTSYLHVIEKRNKKRRKILLDAARPVLAYVARAGIGEDKEGPLISADETRRCWAGEAASGPQDFRRLVKKYCEAAGIDPSRLGSRGIGIHSLRKTAINDAIRNGATMHEVQEFAGHADIRTTEVYFVRREEDAEVAARRMVKKYCEAAGIDPSRRAAAASASIATQDGDQRRDQKWSDDARGAGVCRACGYQDDRGLLRAKEEDAEVAARRIAIRVT